MKNTVLNILEKVNIKNKDEKKQYIYKCYDVSELNIIKKDLLKVLKSQLRENEKSKKLARKKLKLARKKGRK